MLFERQRLLLALLDAIGGSVRHTDFQKLLCFYTHECEALPSYEFVPYRFGAFSFTSYADKRKLIEQGLLQEDDQNWGLTEAGRRAARQRPIEPLRAAEFAQRNVHLRGEALIKEQYRRYPYYATRSEILGKLRLSAPERARIQAAQPAMQPAGLATIGYEGRSLEGYLNALLRDGITLLCDVRRNPLSRKYGFSKSTLSKACEGLGIRYEHLPQLGIASDQRRNLKTQADYDRLFAHYERQDLCKQGAALGLIREWMAQGKRVALTCYEAQPSQCHRHCVADALRQSGAVSQSVRHL